MSIPTRKVGNCVFLDLRSLTLGQRPDMVRDAVREVLKDNPRKIVLNMVEMEYVDSAFIGDLVASVVHVQNQGGKLVLVNLHTRLRELMQITKIFAVFEIFKDEEAALAGCKPD